MNQSTVSLDELKSMFGMDDANPFARQPFQASDEESRDIDAFNDAFDELYQVFLTRRTARGNYLELGTARMVKDIRTCMAKIEARYAEKKPAKRDNLIDVALCALELLSLEHAKGGE